MRLCRPDLHLHSTASDGLLSPADLVKAAAKTHVNLIALTDHDTVRGLEEARSQCELSDLSFIPGVEISAGGDDEVHVLGYGVHEGMTTLAAFLERMQRDREDRAHAMIERLRALGMPLEYDELDAQPSKSVGRPAIARGMIERGYVQSVNEAFERYLSAGLPGYVPRKKIPAGEAIAMLRSEGAVPVLAHPGLLRFDEPVLEPLIAEWARAGLMGIEVHHPAHTPDMVQKWEARARARGLIVTGGSDYHGEAMGRSQIGQTLASWARCHEDALALRNALPQRIQMQTKAK